MNSGFAKLLAAAGPIRHEKPGFHFLHTCGQGIQTRSPVDAAVHLAAPLVTGLEVLARIGYLLDPMTERPTDFRISVLALALFPVLYAAIVVVALVCRCWLD
jgi:hypothetical protein